MNNNLMIILWSVLCVFFADGFLDNVDGGSAFGSAACLVAAVYSAHSAMKHGSQPSKPHLIVDDK